MLFDKKFRVSWHSPPLPPPGLLKSEGASISGTGIAKDKRCARLWHADCPTLWHVVCPLLWHGDCTALWYANCSRFSPRACAWLVARLRDAYAWLRVARYVPHSESHRDMSGTASVVSTAMMRASVGCLHECHQSRGYRSVLSDVYRTALSPGRNAHSPHEIFCLTRWARVSHALLCFDTPSCQTLILHYCTSLAKALTIYA